MIVTTVTIHVKKENVNDFIKASIENHRNSIKEPGNLRFDILQSIENETQFTYYEAYLNEEAVKQHKDTSHYKLWKETVEPWMEIPRTGKPHRVIAPADAASWK
ncbi:MAG: antibiotic biosynthesis monooxygenase [Spirochaetes bacterium]|nr:antibiotic biosynthesis monooxygenase [Spirochaetota bacterium]